MKYKIDGFEFNDFNNEFRPTIFNVEEHGAEMSIEAINKSMYLVFQIDGWGGASVQIPMSVLAEFLRLNGYNVGNPQKSLAT